MCPSVCLQAGLCVGQPLMVFRTDARHARRTPEPAEPAGSDVRPVVAVCANSEDGGKESQSGYPGTEARRWTCGSQLK